MSYSKQQLWQRFKTCYTEYPQLGLALDLSRMDLPDEYFRSMEPRMRDAFKAMAELEAGAIANPDEKRMVGHYWLRNPALAPSAPIREEIEKTTGQIKTFAAKVHSGAIRGKNGPFKHLLLVGIGGSALGPQFVADALGHPATDKMLVHFVDNTDPDGIDRVLAQVGHELGQTLCVVVSKSGGTKETRNGMVEVAHAYKQAGLDFGRHAVAVTSANSQLDQAAKAENWLERFPMWDWVGGRTSETSAVGLLPAALQGIDIGSLLAGAKACDEVTRQQDVATNPAARMALAWYYVGNGKGDRNLIVLPYRDRLQLFSKYLQQLVMESLGKKLDLDGKTVHQGLTVFGNKGSTDQHAYVQQLRDGRNDFFVTFIEVLSDRNGSSMEVEPAATTGDYLNGLLQGTRTALYEGGRPSITLTLAEVSPFSVGLLIALFERTVGFYAWLINVNAYHQPGVEAGKKAASAVLDLQSKIINTLRQSKKPLNAEDVAKSVGLADEAETVFKVCEHLAANPERRIKKSPGRGRDPFEAKYASV